MYDILQSYPSQRETLLQTLDQTKEMPNITAQKGGMGKINTEEALPTMFKDKLEVPPFLLSICIYGKYLHNCLIYSWASCNVMPLTISQRLGAMPQTIRKVVI